MLLFSENNNCSVIKRIQARAEKMKRKIIFALVIESITLTISLALVIIGIVTAIGGINENITIPAFVLGGFLLLLSGSALIVEIRKVKQNQKEAIDVTESIELKGE